MFNNKRLIVARQRRRLTKKELAEKIGLEPRSVSGFEAGQYEPTPDNIYKIARVLGYPTAWFISDDLDIPSQQGVSFRSMSKMSARQRDAAIAAGAIAFSLSDWVEQRFDLPEPDLLNLVEDSPEVAAVSLRQYWGIGERPIKNMVHLLEAKGVRVFSLVENCLEIDAYSLWRNGRPYIFLNTFKSSEHSRFDAAHELGHLVLHKHAAPNGLGAEKEANEFASAFLMPSASVGALGRVAPSLNTLIKLKRMWNVSVAAMSYRLQSLGLISDWHYRSLCIEIQRRGYRTKEPFAARSEASQIWQKVFSALRDEGIGASELAEELSLPPEEMVKLVFGLVTIGLPSSGVGSSVSRRPDLRVVTS